MAAETWQSGDLQLDVGQQRVLRAGVPVELPRLSFDLLLALMRAAPNFVSNEELMAEVWRGVVVSPETVTQRVKLLRDSLGDDPKQPRYIEGLRGRGYRMIPYAVPAAVLTPAAVPRHLAKWWGVAALLVVAAVGAVLLLHGRVGESKAMLTEAGCAIARDPAARAPSRIIEADLAYSRGRTLLGRSTIVGSVDAEREFLHALELDQSYVPAIVGLYDARLQAAKLRRTGVPEALKANAHLLERASALQPDSGLIQLARAMWEPLSPEEKSRLYEEGLNKEPSDARAMTAYAELLDARLGRRAESDCWLQRALQANQLWVPARFLLVQHSFDVVGAGVEQEMRKLLDQDSDFYRGLQRLSKYRWMNHGDTATAISLIERAIRVDPQNPWALHTAVVFYLDAGEPEAADELVRSNPVAEASTAALRERYHNEWRKAGEAAFGSGSFEFNVFERWGVTFSLRDYALKTRQLEPAIHLISDKYGLPIGKDWPINVENFREAGLLAHLLLERGDREEALQKLDQLIAWTDATMKKLGPTNLRPKAQALALQGKTDEALIVLRDSFRQNDYTYWWYTLKFDPTWDKLHDDPRFREIAAEVQVHVDRERAELAKLRRKGQIPDRGTAEAAAITQQRR